MRKAIAWLLGLSLLPLLLIVIPGTVTARSEGAAQSKETESALKTKTEVIKRRDEGREIKVKLRSGKEVKGYVVEINEDSFTVRDPRTGASQAIAYSSVAAIKVKNKGLSTLAKLGIAWMTVGLIMTLAGVNR